MDLFGDMPAPKDEGEAEGPSIFSNAVDEEAILDLKLPEEEAKEQTVILHYSCDRASNVISAGVSRHRLQARCR